jgi:hypothetical protein
MKSTANHFGKDCFFYHFSPCDLAGQQICAGACVAYIFGVYSFILVMGAVTFQEQAVFIDKDVRTSDINYFVFCLALLRNVSQHSNAAGIAVPIARTCVN